MAQQKGMKRAAKVLKRKQATAKAAHKSNLKRLERGAHHGHAHHDHDHAHEKEHA